jgi:hypothetical protein
MLGALAKAKLWRWFLDIRSICKGKTLEVVPRC